MRKLLTVLFGVLLAAAPAAAQDYKPVDVHLGFGMAFPATNVKNDFDMGWNGTIGATFNINEKVGIMGDYTYMRMNGPDKTITVASSPIAAAATNGLIQSNHQMHVVTGNLIFHGQSADRPLGGYVLGGGGWYHRMVQLTSPSVGYATICDPYWYVCYPSAVAVDQIIDDRAQDNFGANVGAGITFGREAKFFVEARYHYVWGNKINPAVVTPSGAAGSSTCPSGGCSSNASYFPITFGFKW